MYEKKLVGEFTYKQIQSLLRQKETSGGRAMLANLRRGVGKTPGELPELWGAFLNELPEELYANNGTPSYAEWAIYLSLTLFALHQQGNSQSAHKERISLGNAAAGLMTEQSDDERNRVLRRFGPVVTAKDMSGLSHHLRGLIQLFKANDIGLDYVRLAEDLYDFQFDESRKKVQLRWAQDFYRINKNSDDSKGE